MYMYWTLQVTLLINWLPLPLPCLQEIPKCHTHTE